MIAAHTRVHVTRGGWVPDVNMQIVQAILIVLVTVYVMIQSLHLSVSAMWDGWDIHVNSNVSMELRY